MDIEEILDAIRSNRVRVTEHAQEEAEDDGLPIDEVFLSVDQGDVIEDYPSAKPRPACLIYGRTPSGEPVHSVWALDRNSGWAVLVTIYRPDPARWVDWRRRRPKS
ncbi:MAG: DUF4258 domain-containing protein [Planctomycetes bacterium]|nr:DUF4258 domain-containing protein [Planctomycetota bacterium]